MKGNAMKSQFAQSPAAASSGAVRAVLALFCLLSSVFAPPSFSQITNGPITIRGTYIPSANTSTNVVGLIPENRLIPWQGNVGVAAGIPNVTTVSATMNSGTTSTAIQNALNAAGSNSVVLLNPGTYTSSGLTIGSDGVVLRGTSPTNTFLVMTGASIDVKGGGRNTGNPGCCPGANITRDAVKGASTVYVTNMPSWVTVGGLCGVDQLDDPAFATSLGQQSGNSERENAGYGNRTASQIDRVVSMTSTSITFEIPIYWGWQTSLVAQIWMPDYNPSTDHAAYARGVENLTIIGGVVAWDSSDSCWVKNVVITNTADGQTPDVQGYFCYRCEVRHSSFLNATSLDAGQGYGVAPYGSSCGWLIEDNIFWKLHAAADAESSSGNAYMYNYETGGQSLSGQNPGISSHAGTPIFNLYEGNYIDDKALADYTHGANAYGTIFRNRITGSNTNSPSAAGGTDDYPESAVCVELEYYNRYWNVVANVLGTTGIQNKYVVDYTNQTAGTQGSIFKFGSDADNNGNWNPTNCPSCFDLDGFTNTLHSLVTGNYDTLNAAQTWDPLITSHVLTNSYLYGSKPPSQGSTAPWPPFDPTNPAGASPTNIAAGYRFVWHIEQP
jgi:hypothetical protein